MTFLLQYIPLSLFLAESMAWIVSLSQEEISVVVQWREGNKGRGHLGESTRNEPVTLETGQSEKPTPCGFRA